MGELTWQGLGLGLIGSLVGVPGGTTTPAAARFSQKLSFLMKAGSVVGYQNLAVTTTMLAKGYREALAQGDDLEAYLTDVQTALGGSGPPIGRVIRANADAMAKTAHQTAAGNEPVVSRTARVAANRVDYNAMLPFLARTFSGIDHEMRHAYVEYADASARYRLWYNLLQYFNHLERATLDVERRAGR